LFCCLWSHQMKRSDRIRLENVVYFFFLWSLAAGCLAAITGCQNPAGPKSINTVSSTSSPLTQRTEVVEKYLTFRRNYVNLHYQIFFQNNNHGAVPGPNDWDIRLLAKVPKEEIDNWVPAGSKEFPQIDPTWMEAIPGPIDCSQINLWFHYKNTLIGIDKDRSIVAYRNSSEGLIPLDSNKDDKSNHEQKTHQDQ